MQSWSKAHIGPRFCLSFFFPSHIFLGIGSRDTPSTYEVPYEVRQFCIMYESGESPRLAELKLNRLVLATVV
jgi:hypothetical protein